MSSPTKICHTLKYVGFSVSQVSKTGDPELYLLQTSLATRIWHAIRKCFFCLSKSFSRSAPTLTGVFNQLQGNYSVMEVAGKFFVSKDQTALQKASKSIQIGSTDFPIHAIPHKIEADWLILAEGNWTAERLEQLSQAASNTPNRRSPVKLDGTKFGELTSLPTSWYFRPLNADQDGLFIEVSESCHLYLNKGMRVDRLSSLLNAKITTLDLSSCDLRTRNFYLEITSRNWNHKREAEGLEQRLRDYAQYCTSNDVMDDKELTYWLNNQHQIKKLLLSDRKLLLACLDGVDTLKSAALAALTDTNGVVIPIPDKDLASAALHCAIRQTQHTSSWLQVDRNKFILCIIQQYPELFVDLDVQQMGKFASQLAAYVPARILQHFNSPNLFSVRIRASSLSMLDGEYEQYPPLVKPLLREAFLKRIQDQTEFSALDVAAICKRIPDFTEQIAESPTLQRRILQVCPEAVNSLCLVHWDLDLLNLYVHHISKNRILQSLEALNKQMGYEKFRVNCPNLFARSKEADALFSDPEFWSQVHPLELPFFFDSACHACKETFGKLPLNWVNAIPWIKMPAYKLIEANKKNPELVDTYPNKLLQILLELDRNKSIELIRENPQALEDLEFWVLSRSDILDDLLANQVEYNVLKAFEAWGKCPTSRIHNCQADISFSDWRKALERRYRTDELAKIPLLWKKFPDEAVDAFEDHAFTEDWSDDEVNMVASSFLFSQCQSETIVRLFENRDPRNMPWLEKLSSSKASAILNALVKKPQTFELILPLLPRGRLSPNGFETADKAILRSIVPLCQAKNAAAFLAKQELTERLDLDEVFWLSVIQPYHLPHSTTLQQRYKKCLQAISAKDLTSWQNAVLYESIDWSLISEDLIKEVIALDASIRQQIAVYVQKLPNSNRQFLKLRPLLDKHEDCRDILLSVPDERWLRRKKTLIDLGTISPEDYPERALAMKNRMLELVEGVEFGNQPGQLRPSSLDGAHFTSAGGKTQLNATINLFFKRFNEKETVHFTAVETSSDKVHSLFSELLLQTEYILDSLDTCNANECAIAIYEISKSCAEGRCMRGQAQDIEQKFSEVFASLNEGSDAELSLEAKVEQVGTQALSRMIDQHLALLNDKNEIDSHYRNKLRYRYGLSNVDELASSDYRDILASFANFVSRPGQLIAAFTEGLVKLPFSLIKAHLYAGYKPDQALQDKFARVRQKEETIAGHLQQRVRLLGLSEQEATTLFELLKSPRSHVKESVAIQIKTDLTAEQQRIVIDLTHACKNQDEIFKALDALPEGISYNKACQFAAQRQLNAAREHPFEVLLKRDFAHLNSKEITKFKNDYVERLRSIDDTITWDPSIDALPSKALEQQTKDAYVETLCFRDQQSKLHLLPRTVVQIVQRMGALQVV